MNICCWNWKHAMYRTH